MISKLRFDRSFTKDFFFSNIWPPPMLIPLPLFPYTNSQIQIPSLDLAYTNIKDLPLPQLTDYNHNGDGDGYPNSNSNSKFSILFYFQALTISTILYKTSKTLLDTPIEWWKKSIHRHSKYSISSSPEKKAFPNEKEQAFNDEYFASESVPNLDAIYRNGLRFLDGDEIAGPDPIIAYNLFKEAAKMGHIPSMVSLAFCYKSGVGVIPNGNRAVYWYSKAAKEGAIAAQVALGIIYQEGLCDQNPSLKKAEKYFSLAVSNGSQEAKYYLQNLWEIKAKDVAEK